VQTADERFLPGGTAYLTDAGMTGVHDSVIGVRAEIAIGRFLSQVPARFKPAEGKVRLDGVLLEICPRTGRALTIERLQLPASAATDHGQDDAQEP
jgi:calcineurin-like phosphoesterase